MTKFTKTAILPDEKVVTRTTTHDYHFCVAVKINFGDWFAYSMHETWENARKRAAYYRNCPGAQNDKWEIQIVDVT